MWPANIADTFDGDDMFAVNADQGKQTLDVGVQSQ
jgi:hypothetical protein